MNLHKLITALFLILPGLSFAAGETPTLPATEPGMLALLGAGGAAVIAVKLFRRKK